MQKNFKLGENIKINLEVEKDESQNIWIKKNDYLIHLSLNEFKNIIEISNILTYELNCLLNNIKLKNTQLEEIKE